MAKRFNEPGVWRLRPALHDCTAAFTGPDYLLAPYLLPMIGSPPTQSAFAVLLQYLARAWRREFDAMLAPLGLSEATGTALLNLGRLGDGVRQGALAESLAIEGPSLVRLLDQLCNAGLVRRHEDRLDRRAKTLHLTPAGQAMVADIEALTAGLRKKLLGGVAEADLDASLRVFRGLEASLGRNPLPPAQASSCPSAS
jgi:MarR family transcriptional regulator for hemolysin